MIREATKLVLGRGEVFFDRFAPGTRVGDGELYLGNTTTFQMEREIERMARHRSFRGLKVEREGTVISESHSINFATDHIDMENVGLWFGGQVDNTDQVGVSVETESFAVNRGRFYQIGKSLVPVIGLRDIDYVRVFVGSALIPMANNYDVENSAGRIQILKNAPNISDGTVITVSFERRNADGLRVSTQPNEVYGAMRFISHNPYGPKKNFFFPMVRLAPRGLVDLKGDEFQQWRFEATVMSLSPNIQQVYIDETIMAENTSDEQVIIDEFGTLTTFPYWEDQLHQIQNFDWPPAVDFQGV